MPLYIYISNIVVLKTAVVNKYRGGAEQFRKDYNLTDEDEDNELFLIKGMGFREQNVDKLIENGLDYDENENFSQDFAIVPRYGDKPWCPEWLNENRVFMWHKDCKPELIQKVETISTTPMSELEKMFNEGKSPFDTIK